MNFKTTVFLLLLLAIVGVYFFVVDQGDDPHEDDAISTSAPSGAPLFAPGAFVSDDVQAIAIDLGDKGIRLTKSGADWQQTAPVRFPLNNWSVNQLGSDAAALRYTDRFMPGTKGQPTMDDTGLAPPRATVTFELAGDKKHVIRLGRTLTIGGRGYLMLDDQPQVYIVEDALHRLTLDQGVTQWRKKSLGGSTEGQASRVSLTRGDRTLDMVKHDGAWAFAGELSGRVATSGLSALLGGLSGIYIHEFVADQPQNLAMYGLVNPSTVLRVESPPATEAADGASEAQARPLIKRLLIGSATDLKQERFFAAVVDDDNQPVEVVFSISKSDAEKFQKSADDLRDPRISLLKPAEVNEVRIQQHDGMGMSLRHSADGWEFGEPAPGFDADSSAVLKLVSGVIDARATQFIANAAPSREPLVTLSLTAGGWPEPEVLKVFEHDGEQYLVIRNNETIGHVLAQEKLASLFLPPLALRDREIFHLPESDITQLTIDRPDGVQLAFTRAVDGSDSAWGLAGFEQFEKTALETLLKQLAPLTAETWPVDGSKPGDSRITLTVGVADGATRVIAIDPDGHLAKADGIDAAFQVKQSLLDALHAEFRPRTVLSLVAGDIEQVTITRDRQEVTLRMDGEGKFTSDTVADIDQSAAAGVFDQLTGLRVQHFITAPTAPQTAAVIVVKATNERTFTLTLAQDNTASLDPAPAGDLAWFILPQSAMDKLTATLMAAD